MTIHPTSWSTYNQDGHSWSFGDGFVLCVLEDRTGVVVSAQRAELYVESLSALARLNREDLGRELLRFGIRTAALDAIQALAADTELHDNGLPVIVTLTAAGVVDEVWTSQHRGSRNWPALRARLIERSAGIVDMQDELAINVQNV